LQIFGDGTETDGGSPVVDPLCIFERGREEFAVAVPPWR
jgi:hypothetical protein